MHFFRLAAALAPACLLLTACGSSDSGAPQTVSPSPVAEAPSSLAGGCFGIQNATSGGFVRAADGDIYRGDGAQTDAQGFLLQPATLDRFLIYAADRRFLTAGAVDAAAGAAQAPTDAAIWRVMPQTTNAGTAFTVVSDETDQFLSVTAAGDLVTKSGTPGADDRFRFAPSNTDCMAYPEMPTGVIGQTYKGNGVDQPIIGFADVHTHMGMSSEMSYAGDVGPSAGGALYGEIFHRFGVPHALENCEDFHGPNGTRDGNNILQTNPTGMHDTQGWPTFVNWPARDELTHQVMYYKWVERAWQAGLRVMVNHGTNIAALCRIGAQYSQMPEADCNDMSVAVKQIEYLYEAQDYIDAQHGGPGLGWYRIVKSPEEARQVINDGKLAVILGVEVAQVFDCGVTFNPDGSETRRCDVDQINAEIDRLWDLGVRHVYPYHDIDSSLGGTGIFSPNVINYLNFLDTGKFWETEDCRAYPEDEPSVRTPGAEQTTNIPGSGNDPISQAFFDNAEGTLPIYPPGPRCNRRHVTDLGMHALQRLMDSRMIIDIDHAAYHSKDIMLDLAAAQTPPYPMASSHDAHGGLTSDQAIRMLEHGGTIYPYKGNGIKHADFLEKLKFWHDRAGTLDDGQILGLGYGADGNGFGGHPGPRGGDSVPVQYPFTLFSGPGWGPQFANIDPVQFELLTVQESGKFWHIDEVGMANYGLVADFVEEVRLESGEEGLTALFNSAEAFIQMWERVYNRE